MIPVIVGGKREKGRGLRFSLLQVAKSGSKIRSDKKGKGKEIIPLPQRQLGN